MQTTIEVKSKLLVIPHIYAENIRIRDIEFARRMVDYFDVYCLKWEDALNVNNPHLLRRKWKQFSTAVRGLVKRVSVSSANSGVRLVEIPILQAIILRRVVGDKKAGLISRRVNTRWLEKLIAQLGITHLLLASSHFDLPATANGVRMFVDLVDWFPEETRNAAEMKSVRTYMSRFRDRADGVFVVSEPLADKLKADYSMNCIPIPNGADIKALRSVRASEIESVRDRWGLRGKYVIGNIGNHGSFTGLDFAVRMHNVVLRKIPNAVLFVVGPADYWIPKLGPQPPSVIFTGQVPPAEISVYFQALDLGILPKDVSLGTDFAFQLKVVEYTACRKFVVSSPLLVWKRLKWPNVRLVDRDVDAWANAICELKDAKWQTEWDSLVGVYDWGTLARRMAVTMLGHSRE
jgi:glycosyltransferase involved in cell wall biosynthesis